METSRPLSVVAATVFADTVLSSIIQLSRMEVSWTAGIVPTRRMLTIRSPAKCQCRKCQRAAENAVGVMIVLLIDATRGPSSSLLRRASIHSVSA
jgi:hypothetical protein